MVDLASLPDPSTRALARELATLRIDVDSLQRGLRATQLQNASIESGTLIVRDGDGTVRQTIGMQPDGTAATVGMNSPTPGPAPTTPGLSPIGAGIMVSWDGKFVAARPADFSHILIHVGPVTGFVRGPATLIGTLSDAGQFPLAPLAAGTYYVVFVAVNTSGLESPASSEASAQPNQVVAQAVLDGIVTETKLADQAVARAKIALQAVGTSQIGGQAVTLSLLADGSVDASKLVDSAVTGPKLVDAVVTVAKLGPAAVTGPAIAASAVTAVKIAASTITAEQVAANTITAAQVAADTLTANQIAANAITASELNAGAVTAGKVVAGAIGADELAANAVTAGKIAADSVTSASIVAGTIQAGDLAADSVSAGKIAANAITTRELAALSVTADQMTANSVTAGAISAGAVTAAKLAATLVLGTTIIAGTAAGARVQLGGFGIEAYRTNGTTKTLDFDNATGDLLIAGQYRSGDGGERVIINTDGTQQFRQQSGSNFSEIANDGSSGLKFRGPAPNNSTNTGYAYLAGDNMTLAYGTLSNATQRARVDGAGVQMFGNLVGMRVMSSGGSAFFARQSGGSDIDDSVLHYKYVNAAPLWGAPSMGSGLVFGIDRLFVTDGNGSAGSRRTIEALSFAVSSARARKVNERGVELPGGRKLRDLVRRAPVKRYERLDERPRQKMRVMRNRDGSHVANAGELVEIDIPDRGPTTPVTYVGPVADDVYAVDPTLVERADGPAEDRALSLLTVASIGWGAAAENADDIDALAARVSDLVGRLSGVPILRAALAGL